MDTQERTLRILSEVTDTQGRELPADYRLFDRGLVDSMTTVQLIAALSEEFGLDISPGGFRPGSLGHAPVACRRHRASPPDVKPPPPPGPPARLWAAGCAFAIVVSLFAAIHAFVEAGVRRHITRFNVELKPEMWLGLVKVDLQPDKLTGVALPRQAYVDPGLLPVYGSSELTQPQTNRADEFFGAHPTGFGAFLMGNPGETCLIIASRLAAAGPDARGKKAVVFLSPGWFEAPELDHRGFGVNFSPLHGGIFAFESRLSPELKRDLAQRLLDYPETIRQNPLLDTALHLLAGGEKAAPGWLDAATPFGESQNQVQREMDYFRGRAGLVGAPAAGNTAGGRGHGSY